MTNYFYYFILINFFLNQLPLQAVTRVRGAKLKHAKQNKKLFSKSKNVKTEYKKELNNQISSGEVKFQGDIEEVSIKNILPLGKRELYTLAIYIVAINPLTVQAEQKAENILQSLMNKDAENIKKYKQLLADIQKMEERFSSPSFWAIHTRQGNLKENIQELTNELGKRRGGNLMSDLGFFEEEIYIAAKKLSEFSSDQIMGLLIERLKTIYVLSCIENVAQFFTSQQIEIYNRLCNEFNLRPFSIGFLKKIGGLKGAWNKFRKNKNDILIKTSLGLGVILTALYSFNKSLEYDRIPSATPTFDCVATNLSLGVLAGAAISFGGRALELMNEKYKLSQVNEIQENFNQLGFVGIVSPGKHYIDKQSYNLVLSLLALDIDSWELGKRPEQMVEHMKQIDQSQKNKYQKILKNFKIIEENFFKKNNGLIKSLQEYFVDDVYPEHIIDFVRNNIGLILEKIANEKRSINVSLKISDWFYSEEALEKATDYSFFRQRREKFIKRAEELSASKDNEKILKIFLNKVKLTYFFSCIGTNQFGLNILTPVQVKNYNIICDNCNLWWFRVGYLAQKRLWKDIKKNSTALVLTLGAASTLILILMKKNKEINNMFIKKILDFVEKEYPEEFRKKGFWEKIKDAFIPAAFIKDKYLSVHEAGHAATGDQAPSLATINAKVAKKISEDPMAEGLVQSFSTGSIDGDNRIAIAGPLNEYLYGDSKLKTVVRGRGDEKLIQEEALKHNLDLNDKKLIESSARDAMKTLKARKAMTDEIRKRLETKETLYHNELQEIWDRHIEREEAYV